MPVIPLISHASLGQTFAWRNGQRIDAAHFLHDVSRLLALLPEREYMLNLCSDRYHFAVGFAASLLRGQISLLPPNYTPGLLEQLREQYPSLYCLTDEASNQQALETVLYPQSIAPESGMQAVPGIPAEQTAAFVFTSGSTGQPMPQRKSWGGLVQSAKVEAERLGIAPHSGMAILGTVPPQHMYGLESTVLIAMHNGLTLCAGRPFYPTDICAQLNGLPQPRGLVTTPVHLRTLLGEVTDLPAVDFLLCATAQLSPQLAAEAEARFAAPLYEIYGCTEAGQVATRRPVAALEWRTFRDVKLRQDEQGTWVGGGHVPAEVLLNDVIELRDTETFLLHGRLADLVNIAGKRTSLASLNYHLNSIEGVRDGVFFMPDESDKEVTRPMAFVVAPGLKSADILNALRQRVDSVFLPRPLCFVDALPRNSTGKLPRDALAQLASQFAKK